MDFFSKESRLSARVMGNVLNFPLYDGDCSPAARALLAQGDVEGAITEWRRLADLGSGRARCVLAYLAFMGTPSSEPDLEEARRLASLALGGERGYANFVLACIALKERQSSSAAQYLGESYKAGFLPAAALLASLTLATKNASEKSQILSRDILRKAARAGYRPAEVALCVWYLRGRFGLASRALGLAMLPIALVKFYWSAKYRAFSVASFQFLMRAPIPLFADTARLAQAREATWPPRYFYVLSITHIAAATVAAVVAISQSGDHSYTRIAEWLAIAVWPYAASYFMASGTVGRNLAGLAVQTLLLVLLTAFACAAYTGQIFGMRLRMLAYEGISVVQVLLLAIASGFGALAAKRVTRTSEPVPHRQLILFSHIVLGLLAASAVFARPNLWHVAYLQEHGLDVAIQSLLALLPYITAAFFALPLVTTNRWKPKAYMGILMVGTALAMTSNGGLLAVPQGVVLMAQFIGFIVAAEWSLDGNEW